MSEYVKLTYGSTDGAISPTTLQEVGKPLQMTMQALSPNIQYYAQAELYDGLQLVSQSLQETFRTLSAGVITLTHVSDVRSGGNYVVTYSVSSTYALSSSVMTINGTNVQGQIVGNTISFVVSGLTMGNTYPYNISTIDIYTETEATSGSLVTVAQNYIDITYSSRTSTSVTFDLDYVSDGGFYEGYIEYWSSEKNPSTEQADGHTFFENGTDAVTQSNLDEGTTYKFRATIIQSVGGTEIYSSVVTQSTDAHDYSGDYLTITSTSANNQVKLKSSTSGSSATIDFSKDGGSTWTSVAASSYGNGNDVATLNNGDKLIMRHTGSIGNGNTQIYCSGSYTVSGNLASLQFGDKFNVSGQTAQEFGSLFENTPVTSAKGLYLGAYSTMSAYSFRYMFHKCTSLTKAPSTLPATTLANNCYQGMFQGCTSLTSAPALQATTLAQYCYCYMFAGCTSLTSSPDLRQVTSIGTNSMRYMFSDCSSLSVAYAPTPSSWETDKMKKWLYGVAASGTLFADQSIAASIPTSSASGVPNGWKINVPDAQPTDYFSITNQTNADNTISIVWQDMNGWEAQDIEFSTDGSNWDKVIATTAGTTIATLPAFGSVKLRHTGTMQGNCFRGTGSHSVGGNIASLDLGSAYNVTDRTMPQAQFIQMFIDDTTLVSAENLNFASYSGANASGCNQMFQGCTALVLPPDLSPIENHYGHQVFDMMFRGCTSLVKGTNLTKLKTYGWRAIFGMYSGCTALSELYYPDFQITDGEWWSMYGDFVDETLGGNAYATQYTYDNITSGDSSQNGWDYVCPSQWTLNVL